MYNYQITLYQTQGDETKIMVWLANEAMWQTADQMEELLQRDRSTIQRHIKRVYQNDEVFKDSTCDFSVLKTYAIFRIKCTKFQVIL